MKRLILITTTLLCLTNIFAATTDAIQDNNSGVDRYAIYIGSNKGGKGREQLLYAGSDAKNFQKAMAEIGGVSENNSFVLIDPSKEKIDETLNTISQKIQTSHTNAKRSEFIFYYSGHSDENALLLGDIPYDYSSLKAAITEVPSDIHVVILDSCYSGNFIRTKGGQKRKPFLIDDSSVVTGHAYLSSSSTNEYSQESDEIESSYFTNAMITGLRGAADTSGDNKVTLNELYSYAFNDTLSKTESSKAGPQHPNYNITLVGSGDLVLSDISNGEAMLSLSKEAKGKFIIRNEEGKLVSEINKIEGQPIFMALSAGKYSALIIDEYSTKQGIFILEKDQIYVLDQNSLSTIKRKTNRLRGSAEIESEDEDIEDSQENRSRRRYVTPEVTNQEEAKSEQPVPEEKEDDKKSFSPFNFSIFPGVSVVGGWKDSTFASLGLFGAYDKNTQLLQASSIMNIVSNEASGFQLAGIFNIAGTVNGFQGAGIFNNSGNLNGAQSAGIFNIAKNVNGIQAAGIFNVAGDVSGVQAAGIFNYAKKVSGLQLGLINISDENDGVAIGLFNFAKDGKHHLGFTWDTNDMFDFYFQSGTRHLYMTIGTALKRNDVFRDIREVKPYVVYAGLGTEFRWKFASIDLEILQKNVIFSPDFPTTTKEAFLYDYRQYLIPCARGTLNLFLGKHLELNAGTSINLQINGYNDRAFEIVNHNLGFISDDKTFCTAFFFGFRIK